MGHIELLGKMFFGVAFHAGEQFLVHFCAAFWRFNKAGPVWIFADGDEQIADGFFSFFNINH